MRFNVSTFVIGFICFFLRNVTEQNLMRVKNMVIIYNYLLKMYLKNKM